MAKENENKNDVKTVRVKIYKDKSETRTHQFVSINEKNYMVKIGEWVDVPEPVAKVLAHREERMEIADRYMAEAAKGNDNR